MAKITTKELKSGVTVRTWTNEKTGFSEKTYYYQGKELAQLGTDGVLYWNSKYWRKPEIREQLKDIYSVIRRRSKTKQFSEYMNI